MTPSIAQLAAMTSALLGLKRHVVGITLLSTRDDYERQPAMAALTATQ